MKKPLPQKDSEVFLRELTKKEILRKTKYVFSKQFEIFFLSSLLFSLPLLLFPIMLSLSFPESVFAKSVALLSVIPFWVYFFTTIVLTTHHQLIGDRVFIKEIFPESAHIWLRTLQIFVSKHVLVALSFVAFIIPGIIIGSLTTFSTYASVLSCHSWKQSLLYSKDISRFFWKKSFSHFVLFGGVEGVLIITAYIIISISLESLLWKAFAIFIPVLAIAFWISARSILFVNTESMFIKHKQPSKKIQLKNTISKKIPVRFH